MTSCLKYDHWREHLTQKGLSKIMLQVINSPENYSQHVIMDRAQLPVEGNWDLNPCPFIY